MEISMLTKVNNVIINREIFHNAELAQINIQIYKYANKLERIII